MATEMKIWASPTMSSEPALKELGALALSRGGRQALAAWSPAQAAKVAHATTAAHAAKEAHAAKSLGAPATVAHVHGERHDLWWEFSLAASFRWQAHLHRISPEQCQQRLHRLTRALGLEGLLGRQVGALTPTSRALADLAVALLPQPDLLLWEEPFYLLGQQEGARAVRLVRELYADGMALVAVATEAPGLDDLEAATPMKRPPLLHLAR